MNVTKLFLGEKKAINISDDKLYVVQKLVNSTEFSIGDSLSKAQVEVLIDGGVTIEITRAKE